MPSSPTSFRLQDTATGQRVFEAVERLFLHHRLSRQSHDNTYYDTFDWRLFRQGTVLRTQRDGNTWNLTWVQSDGSEIQRSALTQKPEFVWNLPPGGLRVGLEDVVEMRRLLPLFTSYETPRLTHFAVTAPRPVYPLHSWRRRFEVTTSSSSAS